MKKLLETTPKKLLSPAFVVFLVTLASSLFFTWVNFSTYRIWNFDLAVLTEVVKSYAEFREPTIPLMGEGFKALGNHFSPILALAAPFYALFPYAFTLNVLMAICFAIAAAILAHTASKFLSKSSAYLIGIGLGISWGFITASGAGFHEYAFGAPILAYALSKFIEGNYLKASIAASLLVFVKEDMGLLLIGLGIVMALRAKSWKWLLLSAWGAAWVILTIKVIIPLISGEWDFSGLVSVDPQTLLIDSKFKLTLVAFLVLQGGLIALRSPLFYIIIPFLAARIFTTWSPFYFLGYHYDTLTVIIASYALLDALMRYEWKVSLKRIAVAIPIITALAFLIIPTPGNNNSWLTRDYSQDAEAIKSYEGAFSAVPVGSTVGADNASIAGFLDRGYETYFIRALEGRDAPDCVANQDEKILNGDLSVDSTISDIKNTNGKSYEIVYESPYINVWCLE